MATGSIVDPQDAAISAGLVYVSDTEPGIRRRGLGDGQAFHVMIQVDRLIARVDLDQVVQDQHPHHPVDPHPLGRLVGQHHRRLGAARGDAAAPARLAAVTRATASSDALPRGSSPSRTQHHPDALPRPEPDATAQTAHCPCQQGK